MASCQEQLGAEDVAFISIQAFPALLDLPQQLEVSRVSCGSRHTAVVTSECPVRSTAASWPLLLPDSRMEAAAGSTLGC